MKTVKIHTLEDWLYRVGLVLFWVVMLVVALIKIILPEGFRLRLCTFYRATGYYCPGCGGTRAFIRLLEGDIIGSFVYHPVVLYVVVIFFTFMISHTIERLERFYYKIKNIKKEKYIIRGLKFRPWYLYGVLVILGLNMVVKNVLIYVGIWNN